MVRPMMVASVNNLIFSRWNMVEILPPNASRVASNPKVKEPASIIP